jgi:hypothetical protein
MPVTAASVCTSLTSLAHRDPFRPLFGRSVDFTGERNAKNQNAVGVSGLS